MEEDIKFRGKISNEKNMYYIVNELSRLPYMRTLSAVKLVNNEKPYSFEKDIFCMVYFDKKYIERIVFGKKFENEDEIQFFYQNLKNDFSKPSNLRSSLNNQIISSILSKNPQLNPSLFFHHYGREGGFTFEKENIP